MSGMAVKWFSSCHYLLLSSSLSFHSPSLLLYVYVLLQPQCHLGLAETAVLTDVMTERVAQGGEKNSASQITSCHRSVPFI